MRVLKKIVKNYTDYQFEDTVARSSIDTIVEQLNKMEVPDKVSDLTNDVGYISSTDADKKYLQLSGGTLSGHIQVGDGNTVSFKKFEAVRQVNSVPNGAAFYVNSDGTASFFHKTYATTGLTNAVNDAILKFNNEGLYFAKGETNRTSATDYKEVLTEETAYKKTESDNKYATKEEVEELQLFKFPNATIFGTPTIQNGQVSNFSNTNYLQFPFLVDFQNRPFNVYFSFTTPSVMGGQENILDSNFGLAFAIRNGKVVAVASDNGTSWTTGELISDETLSPNTTYYFKISWNEGIFGYSGGTAKDNYSISKETVMSNTPYPKTMVIGRSFVDGGNHYNGSINLNDASLEISDKVVWTGMDDVGLATRAAIDLSNIDDKGKEVIDGRIDTKIASKQDTLVSGTNIKTINGNSILGEGNITIQGGEGGGSSVINLTQEEYDALTEKDPTAIYNITDAQDIDVYSKRETYSKTEADNKFSLKGEGKVYTGASGVTVNNTTNTIGVDAVKSFRTSNSTNDYFNIEYYFTTSGTLINLCKIRNIKINNVKESITGNTVIDLDAVYAKKTDVPTVPTFKTINGNEITGEGNIVIGDGGGSFDTNDYYTKTEINDMIGTLNNALNAI